MLTEQNRRMNAAGKKEECSEQTQNIRPVFVRDTASQPKWNG
jgi:nitrous oxide reductase accessory protein NosL